MNSLTILSLAVFVAVFSGVFYAQAAGVQIEFTPPYYYAAGDLVGVLNSFFFAFFFSLLFFGYSAPIVMAIEGAKYASYYASGAIGAVDVAFAIPTLFACFAAISLGNHALRDLRGTGSVFDDWQRTLKYFLLGGFSLGVMLLLKRFIV